MAGLEISHVNDPAEQEAERVADAVMDGASVSVGTATGGVAYRAGGPGASDGGGPIWAALIVAIPFLVAAIVAIIAMIGIWRCASSRPPRTVADAISAADRVDGSATDSENEHDEPEVADDAAAWAGNAAAREAHRFESQPEQEARRTTTGRRRRRKRRRRRSSQRFKRRKHGSRPGSR